MKFVKDLIKKYFGHFVYFYRYLGYRIFVSLLLTFSVGLLDGLGLTMFLPLLKLVSGEEEVSGEGMGGMEVVVNAFERIGIPLTLLSVLLIILFFFILKGIATFVRLYYNLLVQLFFIKKIRFLNVDGLSTFQYKQFVLGDSGRIQNTMSGEVGRVNQAYKAYFNTIQSWIMMLVYLALAFFTNAQFALLVIAGGALSNLAYRQIYKRTKEASSKITLGGHRFQRQLIQMVAHFKYLKATGYLGGYGKKLKQSVLYIQDQQKRIGVLNSILGATREPLNIAVVIGVILVQVTFFEAAMGAIILSLLFFYRALNFIMALQTNWNNFLSNAGALENMTDFVSELKTHKEKYGSGKFDHFHSSIHVNDIGFYYGDTPILKNLSIEIKKNQTIAFVGESGSGKTTLVNLLAGLMPVDNGQIVIDGVSYADIDVRSLQQRIGYITQDPVIFSDSVYDNVTKWAQKTPENLKRFWHALEQAAIDEFVRSLPDEEDSMLGNNGIQVSGGQKQRISIARELYKEVDFLIMDEATSALDSETERAIQENIDALKGKYTIIIVAHRLSTIKNADKIFLLSNGSLIASGDFDQLIEQSELFKRMTLLQEV
jgi:ABC-type multidrug transport system fused ATPase/permease subunit